MPCFPLILDRLHDSKCLKRSRNRSISQQKSLAAPLREPLSPHGRSRPRGRARPRGESWRAPEVHQRWPRGFDLLSRRPGLILAHRIAVLRWASAGTTSLSCGWPFPKKTPHYLIIFYHYCSLAFFHCDTVFHVFFHGIFMYFH